MDWDIEIGKALVFPVAATPDAATLWHNLTGALPDNFQKTGLPPGLLSVASGEWNGFTVTITVQGGKVEVMLTAVDPNAGTSLQPLVGRAQATPFFESLRSIGDKLVALMPSVRFAYAAQLAIEMDSEKAALEFVNPKVKGIFPDDADSVLFQLNRRITHPDRADLGINRLCKWGVSKILTLPITFDGSARVLSAPTTSEIVRPYFHLDVNNVPLPAPAEKAEAKRIMDFLWAETERLIERGYDGL